METRLLIAAATLLISLRLSLALDTDSICEFKSYYNTKTQTCTECTRCAKNQVVLMQCHGSKDTFCATLGNFEFRQRSSGKNAKTEVTYELPKKIGDGSTPTAPTTLVAEDKWFAVTMVLVGILVFTVVLGFVLVLVTCFMCKKKEREIIYDPVYTSSLIRDGQTTEPIYQQFKIISESHRV